MPHFYHQLWIVQEEGRNGSLDCNDLFGENIRNNLSEGKCFEIGFMQPLKHFKHTLFI